MANDPKFHLGIEPDSRASPGPGPGRRRVRPRPPPPPPAGRRPAGCWKPEAGAGLKFHARDSRFRCPSPVASEAQPGLGTDIGPGPAPGPGPPASYYYFICICANIYLRAMIAEWKRMFTSGSLPMMFIVLDCVLSKGMISVYNSNFYIASRGFSLRTHRNSSLSRHLYLRGGTFSRPELNEEHVPSVEQDMEEIRKFAKLHDLPIPSDDPKAVDPEVWRRLFPGGGDCGLDDPRVRYLAQVMPAVEEQAGSDQEIFWPGECVVVSPQNPYGPSYNATVVDLPLVLSLIGPSSGEAAQYHYMRFQNRFQTSDAQPSVLSEKEFLDRYYPDLDR